MRSNEGDDKLVSSKSGKDSFVPDGVGRASGKGTGPTGSSRSYPKGSAVSKSADFNPMKAGKTDYGVCGV